MFTGNYLQKLTANNRLVIPAQFRKASPKEFDKEILWLYPATAGIIEVYTEESLDKLQQEFLKISRFHKDSKDLKRLVFSNLEECEFDDQFRILLSSRLLAHLKVTKDQKNKELVWLGILDYMEIQTVENWEVWQQRQGKESESLYERFAFIFDQSNK